VLKVMMTGKTTWTFREWEESAPEVFKKDSLWKMSAHKYALFLIALSWNDVTKLMQDRRTQTVADQLYEALGSIAANLAEGYSKGTSKDRARFYEYSLGSARESIDWYYSGSPILGEELVEHRYMIPQQRGRILREEPADYNATPSIEDIHQPL